MISKKGQAAMEFLMTYGWAILTVLIVIGALAYFGVLNPGRLLPPKCTMPTGISCDDYIVSGNDDTISLRLTNGLGRDIQVTNISAVPSSANSATSVICNWTTGQLVQNGGQLDLTIPDCTIAEEFIGSNKYRWDIEFKYYYADSSIDYEKTLYGELLTNIEE